MLISNKKMLLSCLSVALVCTAMYPRVAQAAALRRCDVFLPGALGPPKLRVPLRLRGGVAAPVSVRKTNSTSDNSSLSTQASKLITEHKDKSDIFSVYQKGKVLGEGGFAKVYKGKHRITGKEVAIKTIQLCKIPADKLDMLQYEIEVMKMLDHPNIVRLYETFHDEDNHVMHLVMELCEGGDLLDFVLKTEIQENGSRGSTLFSCFFKIKNSFPSSFLSLNKFHMKSLSIFL
jgi:serine/threonine protein kinase